MLIECTGSQGLVHTGIFITGVFPLSFKKKKKVYMKTQKHAIKRCKEHAKPPAGNMTLTGKPRWPEPKVVAHNLTSNTADKGAHSDVALTVYTTALQPVSENPPPGRGFLCGRTAKLFRKSQGFENISVRVESGTRGFALRRKGVI